MALGKTAEFRSTGSEPGGSERRKIGSGFEFKLNKMTNAFFHVRPYAILEFAIHTLVETRMDMTACYELSAMSYVLRDISYML
jgi:hypothetical protein